jgi:DNA-binding transcriptional MerR regulator
VGKKSYRLGDVCRLLDLQPYVLRYWATEFPLLRGEEGANGANRVYSEAEFVLLRRIKGLLYEEGYTIAGAKKKLEQEPLALESDVGAAPLFAPDEPAAPEERATKLDTPDDEQIKTLRRGLTAALKEARAILALLQSRK